MKAALRERIDAAFSDEQAARFNGWAWIRRAQRDRADRGVTQGGEQVQLRLDPLGRLLIEEVAGR